MIQVDSLSKFYGSIQALSSVSFSLKRGETLGLLGQNGAGKSTLLNILTGYLSPSSGEVKINGFDPLLSGVSAKQHLGYLPEQPPLYDEMTTIEYLRFVCELKGVLKKDRESHIAEIMQLTQLSHMSLRLVGQLSKGYRQRVGMAQALCGNPDILILDEPTSGLDPKQIIEMRNVIKELHKGRSILFSSHIISEVEQLCDRVIILHQGKIQTIVDLNQLDNTIVCVEIENTKSSLIYALKQIEGVVEVIKIKQGNNSQSFHITFNPTVSLPQKRVFNFAKQQNLTLLSLSLEQKSLEQIFLATLATE